MFNAENIFHPVSFNSCSV